MSPDTKRLNKEDRQNSVKNRYFVGLLIDLELHLLLDAHLDFPVFLITEDIDALLRRTFS